MVFDYAIFGGGVVGSAIFDKLVRLGRKVILLEKENDVALGSSRANSGLVHAGFDAETGSLKAKLNVRGASLYPALSKELSVPFKKCGALVVGNDTEKLKNLLDRGTKNGVKGLSIIGNKKLHKLVPNLSKDIHSALYSKTAGLTCPYTLTIALAEHAVLNGGKIEFEYNTKEIKFESDRFKISNGEKEIEARRVINSAGAGFNEIQKLLGEEEKPLSFRRGEYFVLDRSENFVNLTIFPLPTEKGKGILATPTVSGNTLLGPTSEATDDYNTKTTKSGLNEIKNNINSMFTSFPSMSQIREYSGIRVGCGKDFIIEKSQKNEKIVSLAGINSPGLTSAPAIAEMVCELFDETKKEIKTKKRKAYTDFSVLPQKKQNKLIKKNRDYGKIVCRCEIVTEGEIKEALASPLKPKTVDGVKRRVRAGMGRCQGGFCGPRVAEIISRETRTPLTKVQKDKAGSYIAPYEIKELKGGEER